MSMGRYLKNLWLALTGCNPFRAELDEKNAQLEKAGDNISGLNDMYYAALCRWEKAESARLALSGKYEEAMKRLRFCERLVENLRERVREKDAAMRQMEEEYRKQIKDLKP